MLPAETLQWVVPTADEIKEIHPPTAFLSDYLTQSRGKSTARILTGLARVPRIDDDGTTHFIDGWDQVTGIYHDSVPAFDVPDQPTDDEVAAAVEKLHHPFSLYSYEEPTRAKAWVLSAIFTALSRPFIDKAPAYFTPSPQPGTGKGKFARAVSYLALATSPVIMQRGEKEEEFEKRLTAVLVQSPASLMIDNANGVAVNGDMIESAISEGYADIRPFGKNTETIKLRCVGMIFINGVNTIITGDMSRRSIRIGIKAKSANPELDVFECDPVEYVAQHRVELLQAAYTCMRAYRLAGMPKSGTPDPGSFEQWTRHVRDLVFWLTKQDVCDAFRLNKMADPKEQADIALLHALHNKYRWREHVIFTANEVSKVYDELLIAPLNQSGDGLNDHEGFVATRLRSSIDGLVISGLAPFPYDDLLGSVLAGLTSLTLPMSEEKLISVLKTLREIAKELREAGEMLTAKHDKEMLVDALEVKFSKRVNAMGFSAWARRRTDAHTGQYMLRSGLDVSTKAKYFSVEKTGE
jgi:hypothetical protein